MTNRKGRWAMRKSSLVGILALSAAVPLGACAGDGPEALGKGDGTDADGKAGSPSERGTVGSQSKEHTALDDRVLDYNEALRTASLKLIRALPTLDQIREVADSADPKAA